MAAAEARRAAQRPAAEATAAASSASSSLRRSPPTPQSAGSCRLGAGAGRARDGPGNGSTAARGGPGLAGKCSLGAWRRRAGPRRPSGCDGLRRARGPAPGPPAAVGAARAWSARFLKGWAGRGRAAPGGLPHAEVRGRRSPVRPPPTRKLLGPDTSSRCTSFTASW